MKNNKKILRIILFSGIFLSLFLPAVDPDLGWQIRCGQEFFKRGSFCNQNSFSVLMENYSWANNSLGYQIILYPFYKTLGLWGLSLLNSIILTLSLFFFLNLKGNKKFKIATLPVTIVLSWSVFALGIRSQILGFMFFLIFLFLKDKEKEIFLPLLMLLWTNIHASFAVGIVLLAFLEVEKIYLFLTKKINLKKLFEKSSLISFSAIITLLNPFLFKLHLQAIEHLTTAHLENLIAEWVPPTPFLKFTIIIFSIFSSLTLLKRKSLPLFELLTLLGLTFLSFKARRNIVFFFFYCFYILSFLKIKHKQITTSLAIFLTILLFSFGFFYQLPRTISINSNWQKYCQKMSACRAVEFLKKENARGNIFNTYEQGGFLIWQRPEQKIFVDGRMPAWKTAENKSPYTVYLETLQTKPGWQETLEEYSIEWLFIGPGTFMDLKLKENPNSFGWEEKYRDEKAVLYKRI